MYPPCNAHALYFYLWPARHRTAFPRYHIKCTISQKNFIEPKMCALISTTIFSEIFLIQTKLSDIFIVKVLRGQCEVPVILVLF